MQPRIVSRAQHTVSRKKIDPNALKVMYRLHRAGFKGYLCGGGVRDLLLGRRPNDFDIATDARPHEVKSLFRNSRIIGRRFRITQVYFKDGTIIQVSTFRARSDFEDARADAPVSSREMVAGESSEASDRHGRDEPGEASDLVSDAPEGGSAGEPLSSDSDAARSLLIRRDNEYGTPEEDAFRRDLTINGLFYDIGNFSIIDYVGGLADLEARIIRVIGEPNIRFQEDPVRMIRAIRHSARLDFAIDAPTRQAIESHARRILECPTARILDEFYRDLRGGAAAPALRMLLELGLLDAMLPDLARFLREGPREEIDRIWRCLEVLDATADYGDAPQPAVLWSVLTGSYLLHRVAEATASQEGRVDPALIIEDTFHALTRPLGVGRKDVDRVKLILLTRRRLEGALESGRLPKTLAQRPFFEDAVSYFDMVTRADDREVPGWLLAGRPAPQAAGAHLPVATSESPPATIEGAGEGTGPRRRRRRRRRGARRPDGAGPTVSTGGELEALVDTEPTDANDTIEESFESQGVARGAGESVAPGAGAATVPRSRRRRGRRRRRPAVVPGQ